MRIEPVGYSNTNQKNNNRPSFGMEVEMMNPSAFEIGAQVFRDSADLVGMIPEFKPMKTKNGEEISVRIWGNKRKNALVFYATAEGQKVKGVILRVKKGLLGLAGEGSTYEVQGEQLFASNLFMPTLNGIQRDLNAKIPAGEADTRDLLHRVFERKKSKRN